MNVSALPTFRLSDNTCIPRAQPQIMGAVTLTSPGLDVMIDLALVKASTIDPETTLARAEQVMIHQGVRLLFVDSDLPEIRPQTSAGRAKRNRHLPARIRGVISLTQVERQLGKTVVTAEIATTFAEIEKALS